MSSTGSQVDLQDRDRVGPVLHRGSATSAVLLALLDLNPDLRLLDRGAYVRVLCRGRCVLTRSAVETHLQRSFDLPRELEAMMPSFKGFLRLDSECAVWEFGP